MSRWHNAVGDLGEGIAFFRWAERWQPWIETDPEVAEDMLEDWTAGVRDL